MRSQVVVVPETFRHAAGTVICSLPEVVVLSVYVPSEFAVQVPLTWSEPVTVTDAQPRPKPPTCKSPLTFRHDAATLQVPTKFPPHAETSEQESLEPLALAVAPAPEPPSVPTVEF